MSKSDRQEGIGKIGLSEIKSLESAEDVEELLNNHSISWKRLGGEERNNSGIVDMGTSPSKSFFERVSNGEDAVIELAAIEAYGDIETAIEELPDNPRDAVAELFDVPDSSLQELDDAELGALAEKIKLRLWDSGQDDRPTIGVRDHGIGQHPDDFVETFLSLNSDNKNRKPFLIGRYGQGGSNTFRYAPYTFIISRSHSGGPIGWTVVKRDKHYETADGNIVDTYVYAVTTDGSIPRINVPEDHDFGGSLVRLIEYDAADFANTIYTRLDRGNLRGLSGHQMFASVLPLRVEDHRGESVESHRVTGNRHVLNDSSYIDEVDGSRTQQTMQISTDYGNLEVRCWIIDPDQSAEDISRRAIVNQFVDPSSPIVFTVSGQVHHEEGKAIFDDANLGFIKGRIIVEVNFDKLDEHQRNLVFSSTRDQAAKGEEYRHVRDQLLKAFKTDPTLQRLEEHYEEKAKKGSATDDDATDELANLMASLDMTGDDDGDDLEGGEGDTAEDDEEGEDHKKEEPPYTPDPVEPLFDEPDRLEIVNPPDPIPARKGGTLTVHLEVNAIDAFDERADVEYKAIRMGDAGDALEWQYENYLSDGHRYITFTVDEDANIGDTGQIGIKLTWDDGSEDGGSESDYRDIKIAKPVDRSPTKGSQGTVPPVIKGVEDHTNSDAPFDWGTESVVEYTPNEDDRDVVWVAMFNEHVQNVLDEVQRSEQTYDRYTRLYKAYIAFYAVQRQQGIASNGQELSAEALNTEQNRFAKTLIQAIAKDVDPEALAL